jgi:hypothetical protein
MSDEQQQSSTNVNNGTTITRTWRLGGPMTAAQRRDAKRLFLDYLQNDPNVSAACDVAGIGRTTAYEWREKDEAFATGWENAIDRTKDVARSSIYKRGILGWDEPVVAQGRVAVDEDGNRLLVHKWSDSLAALYAKANLPEYKEKQTIDLNAQVTTMADQAKDELLADLAAMIANEKTHADEHTDQQE